jgi:hypothetical protein
MGYSCFRYFKFTSPLFCLRFYFWSPPGRQANNVTEDSTPITPNSANGHYPELIKSYSYFSICHIIIYVNIILQSIFFNSLVGGWSPTGSTRHGGHWLAYCSLPRVIMMMENLVEWRLAVKTELIGENPPQRHFVHHKSHLTRPGILLWLLFNLKCCVFALRRSPEIQ